MDNYSIIPVNADTDHDTYLHVKHPSKIRGHPNTSKSKSDILDYYVLKNHLEEVTKTGKGAPHKKERADKQPVQ